MVGRTVHVYVALERDEDGYPPFDVEELDAVEGGEGEFRIDAAPTCAYGVATGDVVRAHSGPWDERLWLREVVRSSQSLVARVIPRGEFTAIDVVHQFESLGCIAREAPHSLVVVDVPPEVPPSLVLDALRRGQDRDRPRRRSPGC